MSLNRREMLRLGAAGAGGLILSSAAASQALPGLLVPQAPTGSPNPFASVPAQPQAPAAPAGIDPQLFARAKAALDQHQVYPRDTIGIADFSKASSEPRFHVVDLRAGSVESHRVCHGRGSAPAHS